MKDFIVVLEPNRDLISAHKIIATSKKAAIREICNYNKIEILALYTYRGYFKIDTAKHGSMYVYVIDSKG